VKSAETGKMKNFDINERKPFALRLDKYWFSKTRLPKVFQNSV